MHQYVPKKAAIRSKRNKNSGCPESTKQKRRDGQTVETKAQDFLGRCEELRKQKPRKEAMRKLPRNVGRLMLCCCVCSYLPLANATWSGPPSPLDANYSLNGSLMCVLCAEAPAAEALLQVDCGSLPRTVLRKCRSPCSLESNWMDLGVILAKSLSWCFLGSQNPKVGFIPSALVWDVLFCWESVSRHPGNPENK